MYKRQQPKPSQLKATMTYKGESIEAKIRRIMTNKEGISDGAERIYTERKDGVDPGMNIRTDRFEIAVDAMDKIHKSKIASREDRQLKRDMGDKDFEQMKKIGKEAWDAGVKDGTIIPTKKIG